MIDMNITSNLNHIRHLNKLKEGFYSGVSIVKLIEDCEETEMAGELKFLTKVLRYKTLSIENNLEVILYNKDDIQSTDALVTVSNKSIGTLRTQLAYNDLALVLCFDNRDQLTASHVMYDADATYEQLSAYCLEQGTNLRLPYRTIIL